MLNDKSLIKSLSPNDLDTSFASITVPPRRGPEVIFLYSCLFITEKYLPGGIYIEAV